MTDHSIDEGGALKGSQMEFRDLLDRCELITAGDPRIVALRRAWATPTLREVMRFMEQDSTAAQADPEWFSDLRRALLEQNPHSLFRVIGQDTTTPDSIDDLRRAVLEKNLHSLFRILAQTATTEGVLDDLRKAVIDQNLHSIFRLLSDKTAVVDNIEDLRKAVIDQNLHSIFRLYDDVEDLRKAVIDQNLHSLFRVLAVGHCFDLSGDIDDLRRAITEGNLHSLFRVLADTEQFDVGIGIDDLRRAVLEGNLHAFFRYLGSLHIDWRNQEDLRKFLLTENRDSGYRLLDSFSGTEIIGALKKIEKEQKEIYLDALSRGQIRSKLWLIEQIKQLDIDLGTVFLCAGWYGILATLLFESGVRLEKIRSFDLDPHCEEIAEIFNKKWLQQGWKFKAVTMDIRDINYHAAEYRTKKSDGTEVKADDIPDTVINTSCEHIENFSGWYEMIPEGTLLILQSNDLRDIDEHVNFVSSLEDFQAQTPMTECLYEGELDLEHYRRFMRIGYR